MSVVATPAVSAAATDVAVDCFGRKPAIVSCSVPPAASGQAIVLYRLLSGLAGDAYCLISTSRDTATADAIAAKRRLPARVHPLPASVRSSNRILRFVPHFARTALCSLSTVAQRARRIAEIVGAEKCGVIIGCTGDVLDLPAAYLAARKVGLPFYAYVLDFYSQQVANGSATTHRVLSLLERWILKRSAGVIVPNEFLRDEYRRRYQVEAVVVRNPIERDVSAAKDFIGPCGLRSGAGRAIRLVYTGSVYQAQFDAFRNLIDALETLHRPDAELHIYTSQSPAELAAGGLGRSLVQHAAVSSSESVAIQRTADILFLPLAFASNYPEIIKTSAPAKLGEYLTSGRPILAHAPADSFLAWYFKKHECGLIVDRPEPKLLREAIVRLAQDDALCRRLVNNASACGTEYQVEHSRSRFFRAIAAYSCLRGE